MNDQGNGEGGGEDRSPPRGREDEQINTTAATLPSQERSEGGGGDASVTNKKTPRKARAGGPGIKRSTRPSQMDSSSLTTAAAPSSPSSSGRKTTGDDDGVEEAPRGDDDGGGRDLTHLKRAAARPLSASSERRTEATAPVAVAAREGTPATPIPDLVGRKQRSGHDYPAGAQHRPQSPRGNTHTTSTPQAMSGAAAATTMGLGAAVAPASGGVRGSQPDWVSQKQNLGRHSMALRRPRRPTKAVDEDSAGATTHVTGATATVAAERGSVHMVQASDLSVMQKEEEEKREAKQLGADAQKAENGARVVQVSAAQAGGVGVVHVSGEGIGKEDGELLPDAERGKLEEEDTISELLDQQKQQRVSVPGAYSVEGINSTHRGLDSDDDSVTEPPTGDREVRRPADMEEGGSQILSPTSSSAPPPPPASSSTDVDIEVVATLVEPRLTLEEGRAEYPEEWGDRRGSAERAPSAVVVAVATAQQLKCGINFSDRRVRLAACLIILVFVALAVGLGVALGGAAGGDGGVASAVGRMSDSEDDSDDEPTTPKPTFSPTSASPTLSPTPAPTVLAWERVGSTLDGEGIGGQFGHQVSISTDGSTVLGGYKSSQEFHSLRFLAISVDVIAARIVEATATEADGEDVWNTTARVRPDCIYWSDTTMALSGSGNVAALASVGCGTFSLNLWSKYPPFALPLPPPPSQPESPPSSSSLPQPELEMSSPSSLPPQPKAEWAPMFGSGDPLPPDYNERSVAPLEAALSGNGGTIAVAHDGSTRVYDSDPPGAPPSQSGTVEGDRALSISADGTTIALAVQSLGPIDIVNDPEDGEIVIPPEPPHDIVKVRRRDGSGGWSQVGPDLGRSATVKSTFLSADGTVLAVGGAERDEMPMQMPCSSCGPERGRVRVYRLDDVDHGGYWTLMGQPLIGDARDDDFGASVSLSGNGMYLVVGVPGSDAGGVEVGAIRVFRYNADGDEWVRAGEDIFGSEGGEAFGSAVAMTGDGRRVAVGAPNNRAGGLNAGRVSVFQLNAT